MSKPSIKVTSVFGESRMEVCDGENTAKVTLAKAGVRRLIEELETILEMCSDDEAEEPSE